MKVRPDSIDYSGGISAYKKVFRFSMLIHGHTIAYPKQDFSQWGLIHSRKLVCALAVRRLIIPKTGSTISFIFLYIPAFRRL
jgi:hypothetical protein